MGTKKIYKEKLDKALNEVRALQAQLVSMDQALLEGLPFDEHIAYVPLNGKYVRLRVSNWSMSMERQPVYTLGAIGPVEFLSRSSTLTLTGTLLP